MLAHRPSHVAGLRDTTRSAQRHGGRHQTQFERMQCPVCATELQKCAMQHNARRLRDSICMHNRLGNCGHGQMAISVYQVGGFTLIRRCTSSRGTTIVVLSSKKTLSPEGTSLYSTTSHHRPFTRVSIVSVTDVAILWTFVVITHVPNMSILYYKACTKHLQEILSSFTLRSRGSGLRPRVQWRRHA